MPDEPQQPSSPITVKISSSAIATGQQQATVDTAHPNLVIQVMQPLTIIVVRASRTFLQTLLATLTAGMVGVMPAKDFMHLLIMSASISVASAVVCIIQNMIELLARFDQSHPTLAG